MILYRGISLMKYALLVLIALWALGSFACGGGGSNDSQHTTTTSPASSLVGTSLPGGPPSSGNSTTSTANAGTLSGIFDTIFSSGLLNGSATTQSDNGDPTLKDYLLTTDDLPAGFTSQGSFSEPIPSGVPSSGVGDVAVSVATKGDPQGTNGDNLVVLGSIALKLTDPTALQQALSEAKQLNAQDLKNTLGGGSAAPFVTNVQVLDTSSLGDNAVGLAVSLDLSDFINQLASAFGASATPSDATPINLAMTMHIYLSVHGSLAGGVVSVALGGGSSGVDELSLAKIVDHKLAATSGG
jgi:hypothetical protein